MNGYGFPDVEQQVQSQCTVAAADAAARARPALRQCPARLQPLAAALQDQCSTPLMISGIYRVVTESTSVGL